MAAVHARLRATQVKLHRIGAEDLDPKLHGRFSVIFSVNVLEHIAALDEAMAAMSGVLAAGGVMIYTCANYQVPYEPHYGILLLPVIPARTPWARHLRKDELWRSLNFVTASRLRALARRNGLSIAFDQGVMAEALERLLVDEEFARRHRGLVAAARIFRATGALALLRRWPARWATPLRVRLSHLAPG